MQQKKVALADLRKEVEGTLKTLERRVHQSAASAADFGRLVAFDKAPVAFGELREGLTVETTAKGSRIVSTAPYSAAVEVGSRPHWPPLEPILAWVRLRGTQAVDVAASGGLARGKIGRVGADIRRQGSGTSTPVDAAVVVANTIRAGIAKHGTRPHHFMGDTMPETVKLLDAFIKSRFSESL